MLERTWSPRQLDIHGHVAEPARGSLIIRAVAGSGKTTTIVEAVRRAVGSHIFLAFNKAIATELAARGVNARTFHSLCFTPVLRSRRAKVATPDKLRRIVDDNLGDADVKTYGAFICRLVGLARNAGVGCLVADDAPEWQALIDRHDLELESDSATFYRAILLARRLLASSNDSDMVDFDDMLYFAVRDGITLPKFANVFVDEAQDTNAIQRAVLRKILADGGRVYAVGDAAQAIYGFRGADSDSLDLIASEFGCMSLPLDVTYRCPVSVVEFARQWSPDITAAPGAPAGVVAERALHLNDGALNAALFASGDLVVCRTTKPLIKLAYQLLKAGKPARVMGREIGAGLKALIERMNGKGIDGLVTKLTTWTAREVEKAIAKRQDAKAEAVQDKTDCVLFLADSLPETDRTIPALLRLIDKLFSDTGAATVLATIHKAKGLEADRVYWLNSSKCPAKWAKQEWQQQQERNLCYVAATRAKSELLLIEENDK